MKTIILSMAAVLALAGSAAAQNSMTAGQVQKIDPEQGKVTLRHEAIKNLDMDSMTMVFRVQNPEMLKGLKAGDRVKFAADRVNGQITIIQLEKAK
jgi:Cu(I)/Ag(I) efflux system periplasmic protein CusF